MTTQLSTTAMSQHFGVTLSAVFITDTLGVPNDGKLKAAILWNEDKVPVIARALVNHVAERGNAKPAFQPTKPIKAPKVEAKPAADLTDDDLGL